MDVHFTPEQEAKLSQMAQHQCTDATQLVRDAALRLLDEEEQFRIIVQEGIAAADRGDFVEHAQVWAGVEEILSGR
jgi:predicted transcriptional regulator